SRNQLVSMNQGAAVFSYDAVGRRTSKTINGTTIQFLHDDLNTVQELSGSTPTANLLVGGLDEDFQRTDANGSVSFLNGSLGSTLALTDGSGNIQSQYTYDPFGNTSEAGVISGNPSAYSGRELDATGLYFYRARYYNPSLGRFISEDPIGFGGGQNLYSFV